MLRYTTVTFTLQPAWLSQMLGYVLLDDDPTQPVGGVGFYPSRQGVLVRWSLTSLFKLLGAPSEKLSEFRVSFREMLQRDDEGLPWVHYPRADAPRRHKRP